jgi:hypothetical protein
LPLIGERKLEFWKARAVRSGFFFLATTVSNNHHSGRHGITKISSSPRLAFAVIIVESSYVPVLETGMI